MLHEIFVSGGFLCTSRRGFYVEKEEVVFFPCVSPGFMVSDSFVLTVLFV